MTLSDDNDVPGTVTHSGRRMTLKEVAAALRVSPMTVSNAYNRPDRIASATRARVLAGAARLGYPGPDPTARSLRRGRAGAVGMLYSGPLSYAFSDPAAVLLLQGVSLATEADQLGLLLLSGAATDDPTIVTEAAVDGLIVLAMSDNDPLLEAALGRRLPLVLVDQWSRPEVPSVGIDDEGGARAAAAHVLSLGHRHIGIIALGRGYSGPSLAATPRDAAHPVARLRLRGYAAAMAEAGISWAAIPVFECASLEPINGAEAAAWLLGHDPQPTALLAMSDQLALGALDAARALALGVPTDLSVVGFDDVPAAARAEPALTTVRQPHVEKGQRAARILLDSLREPASNVRQSIILPTELIVRRSTARPRRLDRT